ncbi:snapalysin family zinc-dependent metalloprotease [Actinomadura sp. HBU206391]|nr:snapalysin family zinc-dependent metalloprotease [Actinomadura sp. HBU206391]
MLHRTAARTLIGAWNSSVQNVRLVKVSSGGRAEIRIVADDGWPRATLGPVRPGGRVTVWFGRQAVNDGYDTTRIAAHELGHSLGLPDRKPGPCSSLMSGSTGGVACSNATPNAAERSAVNANYAGAAVSVQDSSSGGIVVDAP